MLQYSANEISYGVTGVTSPCPAVLTIPETLNGLPVFRVEDNAFKDNANLEEVYLPDSILHLQENAFKGCVNLRRIHFYATSNPAQQITLYRSVFQDCVNLECITFEHRGIFFIMYDATRCFAECHKLNTIEADFDYNIPGYTFYHCYELDNLVFTQALEMMMNGVTFATTSLTGCKKLDNITLLTNLSSFTPHPVIKRLSKMNIKSTAKTNVARVFGTKVQILP